MDVGGITEIRWEFMNMLGKFDAPDQCIVVLHRGQFTENQWTFKNMLEHLDRTGSTYFGLN